MDLKDDENQVKESLHKAARIQDKLDRKAFDLKTLYDASRDVFCSVETGTVLRNFLLMAMGSYGILDGFVMMDDESSKEKERFVLIGFHDNDKALLKNEARQILMAEDFKEDSGTERVLECRDFSAAKVACLLPFFVESGCRGILGLGPKLVDEPFNDNDIELLDTLLNNLVGSLKNARSFEKIHRLNIDLQVKNEQLETTLGELKAAMRKVEILESVKANLGKFVPTTVFNLIEKSPSGEIPDSRGQDVSVLFLDIEGYTKLCEDLEDGQVNEVVEKYFSVFMDAIYENEGDVNETAGDGLMVIFLNEDQSINAVQAIRTALTVQAAAARIHEVMKTLPRPLVVNMGIHSGQALVGTVKFESYTGSRWTYTARGITTNIAARIGAKAMNGQILVSGETAERAGSHFLVTSIGAKKLKNVTEQVEIFEVKG